MKKTVSRETLRDKLWECLEEGRQLVGKEMTYPEYVKLEMAWLTLAKTYNPDRID